MIILREETIVAHVRMFIENVIIDIESVIILQLYTVRRYMDCIFSILRKRENYVLYQFDSSMLSGRIENF